MALPSSLVALSGLQQLREWHLALALAPPQDAPMQARVVALPPPSAFPHLCEYDLFETGGYIQVGTEHSGCCRCHHAA